MAATAFLGPQAAAQPKGVEHRIEVDGKERSYIEYLPATAPEGPLPVVFVCHGEGGFARNAESYFEMNGVADKGGFIVLYPDGLEKSWNDGRGVAPGGTSGVDDVAFVRAVLEDVAKRHPVDRSRVFATGMSTGGMFCHRLAAEAPDVFLAIAPVAGPIAVPYFEQFKLERPVSMFLLQGDSDPIVPVEGGAVYPKGIQRRGRISPMKDTLAKYLEAAEITGEPASVDLEDTKQDGTKTRRDTYGPGKDGARVQLDLILGGGHNLPGRARDFPEWAVGKVSEDYDGAEAIWNFFKACPPRPASH
jgi:polyhydroxybutyrate depolymerase